MFEKTFIALFNMSQDKQYCFNLLQLLNEKKDARNSASNRDDNWKAWHRFLICSKYYHDLICNKSSCKISDFLNVGNIILLSELSEEEKTFEIQKHCRNYYQNF